jgi:hypothetical protein
LAGVHSWSPSARPWLAAGDNANPAVMELEIERRAGSNSRRFGDDPGDGVADDNIAAGEQAFVAFGMGREPPGEIVERVVVAVEKSRHRVTQPRFDICDASAGAGEIGRQHRRPQSCSGQVQAVLCCPQQSVGGEPQPLGTVIQTLSCGTDQVVRIGKTAGERGEMQPALVKEPGKADLPPSSATRSSRTGTAISAAAVGVGARRSLA